MLFSSERALCRYISQHPKRLKVNKPTVILIQLVRGNQGKKIDFFSWSHPVQSDPETGKETPGADWEQISIALDVLITQHLMLFSRYFAFEACAKRKFEERRPKTRWESEVVPKQYLSICNNVSSIRAQQSYCSRICQHLRVCNSLANTHPCLEWGKRVLRQECICSSVKCYK